MPGDLGLDNIRSLFAQEIDLEEIARGDALSSIIKNKNANKLNLFFKYDAISEVQVEKATDDENLKKWYEEQYESFCKQRDTLMQTIQNENATKGEVREVLNNWGEVNSFVKNQRLLIYAVSRNNEYAVDWLLSQEGVNVNVKYHINGGNITPLGVAIQHGYTSMVQKLIDTPNIDVSQVLRLEDGCDDDMNGESALEVASGYGQFEIVQTLLDYGTNKYSDLDKACSLVCAFVYRHYKVADLLIRHYKTYEKEYIKEKVRIKLQLEGFLNQRSMQGIA